MNEVINFENAMARKTTDAFSAVNKIYNNLLITRGEVSESYRPYTENPAVTASGALGYKTVNLDMLYPKAEPGDFVYIDFCIFCSFENEVYLNVGGRVSVFYNDECIFDRTDKKSIKKINDHNDLEHLAVSLKPGSNNRVRIKCVKGSEPFEAFFMVTTTRYIHMWANDYLYNARAVLPYADKIYEEGVAISECFKGSSLGGCRFGGKDYRFGLTDIKNEEFDFDCLCGSGDTAYVYTEAIEGHKLSFAGNVTKIFINGIEVLQDFNNINVEKGDKILFRCTKKSDWKLSLNTKCLALPFLKSDRKMGVSAIYTGPFYGDIPHAPEKEWDFARVFTNEKGKKLYWRFCDNSQMRIYIDSAFFGQWFYALMVGFYGIRDFSEVCKNEEAYKMFCRNMKFIAKHYDYIKYDIETNVMPAFMPRIGNLNVLDNIGTMGMNLADAYIKTKDKDISAVLDELIDALETRIPRFEDGTFNRTATMWADDLFMSCPFLVRMAKVKNDSSYYDKAAKQILGFKSRMYMEDEKLFSHIYFPDKGVANRVPWGRGNGWVMWTMTEYLMYADKDSTYYNEILELFKNMAEGIKAHQHPSGLWRQVIDRHSEDSFIETSCSAMFLLSFTRGIKYGWLDESFKSAIDSAWFGLTEHSIDENGDIYGVCMGSGCSMDAGYYCTLNTIVNDDHGTGIVLAAAAEYAELKSAVKREAICR